MFIAILAIKKRTEKESISSLYMSSKGHVIVLKSYKGLKPQSLLAHTSVFCVHSGPEYSGTVVLDSTGCLRLKVGISCNTSLCACNTA